MRYILYFAILIIGPWGIGAICSKYIFQKSYGMRYLNGLLVMWAMFFLLSIPFYIWKLPFHILCMIYTIILFILCIPSVMKAVKYIYQKKAIRKKYKPNNGNIYMMIFAILFLWQMINIIYMDAGANAADDYIYVGAGNAAIHDDFIVRTDIASGVPTKNRSIKYGLQSIIYFNAYMAKICNLPIAIVCHTLFPVVLLGSVYLAYYMLTVVLFKSIEDRFIFLSLISILYIWGLYSHYSVTFRLLVCLWQGKAILATLILPIYLYSFYYILQNDFKIEYAIYLTVLSIASISLTLGGIVSAIVVTITSEILQLTTRKRNYKNLLYIPWSIVFPCIMGVIYIQTR